MTTVALYEAKNRLSELIKRLHAGEEFDITRRGKVVARLALPAAHDAGRSANDAIAGLRAARRGVSLGRLNSRDLIAEGRR